MSATVPNPLLGRAIYEGVSGFRAHDDYCDSKRAGAYYHIPSELSATEFEEILDAIRYLIGVNQSGNGSIAVRNETGGALAAGTLVYISGYSIAHSRWLVSKADKGTANLAQFVLLSSLADVTNGVAYCNGTVSGVSGFSGTMYLGSAGAYSCAVPSLPDRQQIVGFGDNSNLIFRIVPPQIALLTDVQDVDTTGIADGNFLIWSASTNSWIVGVPSSTDEKVKTSSDDPTAGYLSDKIDNDTIIANEGDTIQIGTVYGNNVAYSGISGAHLADGVIENRHFSGFSAASWSDVSKTDSSLADLATKSASDLTSGTLDRARLPAATVVDNTAGDTLDSADYHKIETNAGATAEVELTLPSAAANLGPYIFYCADTDGIKIRAATGDYIRIGAAISSAAGYASSTAIGSSVTLVAIDNDNWVAIASVGTWSLA